MVLYIFVEGCEDSMNCRYSEFSKFRTEILRGWNEELGKLYEKKLNFMFEGKMEDDFFKIFLNDVNNYNDGITVYMKEIDEKINKILDEYDKPYNKGMKIFFFHSDCDGEITSDESVLVLEAFRRVDPEKFDNSDEEANIWHRKSYQTWINMLKYSIENGKSIIFD